MRARFVRATSVGMLVLFVPALVINVARPAVVLEDHEGPVVGQDFAVTHVVHHARSRPATK